MAVDGPEVAVGRHFQRYSCAGWIESEVDGFCEYRGKEVVCAAAVDNRGAVYGGRGVYGADLMQDLACRRCLHVVAVGNDGVIAVMLLA